MLLCAAFLTWALCVSQSHATPMKITPVPSHKNHTAICAEIEKELSADGFAYTGMFKSPQNTSKEPCYGEFTKQFISTLKNVSDFHKSDSHIRKIYKDMTELTRICRKLKPTECPKNCIMEQGDFSHFKRALKNVVRSIERWGSCNAAKSGPWDPVLPPEPGAHE